jgi:hypothetical protein
VRPELRRKVMAKLDAAFLRTASFLTMGKTHLSEKRKALIHKGLWQDSPQRKQSERKLQRTPDKEFEAIMANLDALPNDVHKAFKDAIRYMPKNRGGRPAAFPLEMRKRAIQDVGHEYPRCDSFRDAIELVAHRYGMTPDYLRKVWKNRKRLKRDQ